MAKELLRMLERTLAAIRSVRQSKHRSSVKYLAIASARAHELSQMNNIAAFTGMCCAALWIWFGVKLSRRTQRIPSHR